MRSCVCSSTNWVAKLTSHVGTALFSSYTHDNMDSSFRNSSSSNGRPLWLVFIAGVGVLYMAYSLLFAPAPGAAGPKVTKARMRLMIMPVQYLNDLVY